ncbi:hypothetical protein PRIPAC_73967, partial [Pristionchus pacificus]|uniref:Uncharacterized protein n=1 Tax=Pristionchus pacificus TaxID=54126 RepID=A0A8R1Z8N9_PRIPA
QMTSIHMIVFLLVLVTSAESYSRFGSSPTQPRGAQVVKRQVVSEAAGSYSGRFRSGGQDVLTRYLGFV